MLKNQFFEGGVKFDPPSVLKGLKHPIFNVVNFKGWIKLIYDKIISIYCVENELNHVCIVQQAS